MNLYHPTESWPIEDQLARLDGKIKRLEERLRRMDAAGVDYVVTQPLRLTLTRHDTEVALAVLREEQAILQSGRPWRPRPPKEVSGG